MFDQPAKILFDHTVQLIQPGGEGVEKETNSYRGLEKERKSESIAWSGKMSQ